MKWHWVTILIALAVGYAMAKYFPQLTQYLP
jgi:hypothetical protein